MVLHSRGGVNPPGAGPKKKRAGDGEVTGPVSECLWDQSWRSTIIFLIDAMALAGFRPLGQVLAQFMMVWQR